MSSGVKLMNKRNTLPKRKVLRKKQTHILELKNSMNKRKNALESTGNGVVHKGDGYSKRRRGRERSRAFI